MNIKKSIGFIAIFCTVFLSSTLTDQNDPTLTVVTRFHFDPSSGHTFDEWKAVEKEYFNKVTLKNDLILGANVLVGGSNHSVALQPLSVQGQVGLNIAAGVGALDLHLAQ